MPKIQSWLNSGGRQPSSEQPSSSSGLRRKQAGSGLRRLALERFRSDLGQLALRKLPSAADRGAPSRRASDKQPPVPRRWPATQAFDFDIDASGMNEDEMREPIGLRRLRRPGAGRCA